MWAKYPSLSSNQNRRIWTRKPRDNANIRKNTENRNQVEGFILFLLVCWQPMISFWVGNYLLSTDTALISEILKAPDNLAIIMGSRKKCHPQTKIEP